MTDDPRADLLHELASINQGFERKGVPVDMTVDEVENWPIENLRAVVTGSRDHLTHVLQQLRGL